MPIPYLPLDVVATILESRWLPPTTLANCCLVNRSWLDISRRRLYRSISVVVCERWGSDADEEDEEADIVSEYSEATSQLRQTLETNPILAACVREIAFVLVYDDEDEALVSDRIDSPESAVQSFVKLCQQARSFSFGNLSGCTPPVEVQERVGDVHLFESATQSWGTITKFKNLKTVVCNFASHARGLSSSYPPLTACLINLTLFNATAAEFKLFDASYSTITSFTCNLRDLLNIDLALLEALQQLTVQVYPKALNITQPIKRCLELRSLSIRSINSPLTESQCRKLFGSQAEDVPLSTPSKLHLLRFTFAPSPDVLPVAFRVFPSGAASKQLSISTRKFGKLIYNRDADEVPQYVNQVRTTCRAEDVELFLMENDEGY